MSSSTWLCVFSCGAGAALPQPNVQGHHHHEAQDGGPGRQLPVATAGTKGDGVSSGEPGPAFWLGKRCFISHLGNEGSSSLPCASPMSIHRQCHRGVSPGLCLGDDIVHHHVDHGSGGKAQGIGEQRFGHHHGEGTEHAGQGLHHPAQLPVPAKIPTQRHRSQG